MDSLENLIVTNIHEPGIVHSKKGRHFQMENRLFYGLSFCISGQITYTMNGKKYRSDEGVAVLLPSGGTYSLYGDKEGFFPLVNFECTGYHSKDITVFPLDDPKLCIQTYKNLQNMFLNHESNLKIYSTFYTLLSLVSTSDSKKHYPLDSVISYITDNLQNPNLSNLELAKQLGISEVYLRKMFLLHYNITPKQYILNARIRKSKQMLCDTPFTVTAIAEECGFSSVYHFCRSFKQHTGKTPTEYAMENKIYQI